MTRARAQLGVLVSAVTCGIAAGQDPPLADLVWRRLTNAKQAWFYGNHAAVLRETEAGLALAPKHYEFQVLRALALREQASGDVPRLRIACTAFDDLLEERPLEQHSARAILGHALSHYRLAVALADGGAGDEAAIEANGQFELAEQRLLHLVKYRVYLDEAYRHLIQAAVRRGDRHAELKWCVALADVLPAYRELLRHQLGWKKGGRGELLEQQDKAFHSEELRTRLRVLELLRGSEDEAGIVAQLDGILQLEPMRHAHRLERARLRRELGFPAREVVRDYVFLVWSLAQNGREDQLLEAVLGLREAPERAGSSTRDLARIATATSRSHELRAAAIEVLGLCGARAARSVPVLEELLEDDDARIAELARAALSTIRQ